MSLDYRVRALTGEFRDLIFAEDPNAMTRCIVLPVMKRTLDRLAYDTAQAEVCSLMRTMCVEHGHTTTFCPKGGETATKCRLRKRSVPQLVGPAKQIPSGRMGSKPNRRGGTQFLNG